MFSTNHKRYFPARITMKTLLEMALVLIVYSQLYPGIIEPTINSLIATSDSITGALISLIPFVIAAMILIGIFVGDAITG